MLLLKYHETTVQPLQTFGKSEHSLRYCWDLLCKRLILRWMGSFPAGETSEKRDIWGKNNPFDSHGHQWHQVESKLRLFLMSLLSKSFSLLSIWSHCSQKETIEWDIKIWLVICVYYYSNHSHLFDYGEIIYHRCLEWQLNVDQHVLVIMLPIL